MEQGEEKEKEGGGIAHSRQVIRVGTTQAKEEEELEETEEEPKLGLGGLGRGRGCTAGTRPRGLKRRHGITAWCLMPGCAQRGGAGMYVSCTEWREAIVCLPRATVLSLKCHKR